MPYSKPAFFCICLFLVSCYKEEPRVAKKGKEPVAKEVHPDSTLLPAVPETLPVKVSYKLLPADTVWKMINGSDSLKYSTLEALNRMDIPHARRADSLLVPDSFFTDINRYSPFPSQVTLLQFVPKCILFSYLLQAFAAYENGKLWRWGPVSLGKKSTPTPPGLYHCNWKSRKTISTIDEEWVMEWYVNLHNELGVSMHEYDLPGFPASHACMRLLHQDAIALYRWTDSWELKDDWNISRNGTPVIVFGAYPYGERKPWLLLTPSGQLPALSEEELNRELTPFLPALIVTDSIAENVNPEK